MICFQRPSWEVFIHWEDKASVRRFIIEKFFELDRVLELGRDEILDLLLDHFLGFAKGHAAVDEDDGLIRYSIDGWGLDVQVRDGNLAVA